MRGRGAHGERGAAVLEFALVGMLLFTLLFGIVEYGYQYNNFQAVRQGVREGARQGVVNDAVDCPISGIANVSARKVMCTTRARVAETSSVDEADVITALRVKMPAEPGPGAYGQLVVCAQHQMRSLTGLMAPFTNGRWLSSRVQMRIERPQQASDFPPGTTTRASQTAPDADWSWCGDPS
jgi:Flp pilus assembly protein TadG